MTSDTIEFVGEVLMQHCRKIISGEVGTNILKNDSHRQLPEGIPYFSPFVLYRFSLSSFQR
jgi:hypothetical protein